MVKDKFRMLNGESTANCKLNTHDLQKIYEVHDSMGTFLEHAKHLDKLESIDNSICRLGESVTVLSSQHRDVMRWLLVVVCAIALGKGALEMFSTMEKSGSVIKSTTP